MRLSAKAQQMARVIPASRLYRGIDGGASISRGQPGTTTGSTPATSSSIGGKLTPFRQLRSRSSG
jgi:hypothetical protein